MNSIYPLFFLGFGTAAFHVLTGPDHLAAVTPLVLEEKKRFTRIGAVWGAGHLFGMLLIGLLYVLFRQYIPIEMISGYSEQLVAFVLVFIGVAAVRRALKEKHHHVHPHVHEGKNGAYVHIHKHSHPKRKPHTWQHSHEHADPKPQLVSAALGIGVLHGFAGIAHFVLLLPALGFTSNVESIVYMAGFALGVVLAMGLYAFLLGRAAHHFTLKGKWTIHRSLRIWGGALAIVVGVYWFFMVTHG